MKWAKALSDEHPIQEDLLAVLLKKSILRYQKKLLFRLWKEKDI